MMTRLLAHLLSLLLWLSCIAPSPAYADFQQVISNSSIRNSGADPTNNCYPNNQGFPLGVANPLNPNAQANFWNYVGNYHPAQVDYTVVAGDGFNGVASAYRFCVEEAAQYVTYPGGLSQDPSWGPPPPPRSVYSSYWYPRLIIHRRTLDGLYGAGDSPPLAHGECAWIQGMRYCARVAAPGQHGNLNALPTLNYNGQNSTNPYGGNPYSTQGVVLNAAGDLPQGRYQGPLLWTNNSNLSVRVSQDKYLTNGSGGGGSPNPAYTSAPPLAINKEDSLASQTYGVSPMLCAYEDPLDFNDSIGNAQIFHRHTSRPEAEAAIMTISTDMLAGADVIATFGASFCLVWAGALALWSQYVALIGLIAAYANYVVTGDTLGCIMLPPAPPPPPFHSMIQASPMAATTFRICSNGDASPSSCTIYNQPSDTSPPITYSPLYSTVNAPLIGVEMGAYYSICQPCTSSINTEFCDTSSAPTPAVSASGAANPRVNCAVVYPPSAAPATSMTMPYCPLNTTTTSSAVTTWNPTGTVLVNPNCGSTLVDSCYNTSAGPSPCVKLYHNDPTQIMPLLAPELGIGTANGSSNSVRMAVVNPSAAQVETDFAVLSGTNAGTMPNTASLWDYMMQYDAAFLAAVSTTDATQICVNATSTTALGAAATPINPPLQVGCQTRPWTPPMLAACDGRQCSSTPNAPKALLTFGGSTQVVTPNTPITINYATFYPFLTNSYGFTNAAGRTNSGLLLNYQTKSDNNGNPVMFGYNILYNNQNATGASPPGPSSTDSFGLLPNSSGTGALRYGGGVYQSGATNLCITSDIPGATGFMIVDATWPKNGGSVNTLNYNNVLSSNYTPGTTITYDAGAVPATRPDAALSIPQPKPPAAPIDTTTATYAQALKAYLARPFPDTESLQQYASYCIDITQNSP